MAPRRRRREPGKKPPVDMRGFREAWGRKPPAKSPWIVNGALSLTAERLLRLRADELTGLFKAMDLVEWTPQTREAAMGPVREAMAHQDVIVKHMQGRYLETARALERAQAEGREEGELTRWVNEYARSRNEAEALLRRLLNVRDELGRIRTG